MKKHWFLSASAISCFKSCAMRFFYNYICGLKPIEDTDSQRQGTNWHKIQQIMTSKGQDAVVEYLNKVYSTCPLSKTRDEWETERVILLYSLIAYNWYYSNESGNFKVLAQEKEFSIPLLSPTGRCLPNVQINGRIDKIVEKDGKIYIKELKSTGKPIDSDSSYWNHLNLDTQTTLYPYALYNDVDWEGQAPSILYDVWHKPGIRPKKLTQAESKKFVETGEYCGQKFGITGLYKTGESCIINTTQAIIEPGAKEGTFAIQETPEMFGARLLQDITERPEFYFVQKEINRTEEDYKQFQNELYNIYQTIRLMAKNNAWFKNEQQCESSFKCPFIKFCYNNVKIQPGDEPEGFKKANWVDNKGDK